MKVKIVKINEEGYTPYYIKAEEHFAAVGAIPAPNYWNKVIAENQIGHYDVPPFEIDDTRFYCVKFWDDNGCIRSCIFEESQLEFINTEGWEEFINWLVP